MAKNRARLVAFWVVGAAFVAFSGAVYLGWLYEADLWALQETQEHPWNFLHTVSEIFSFFGGAEVTVAAFSLLLVVLFLYGRRALAGRLLAVFMATALVELAMKLYLPQDPLPEGSGRAEDFAPLVVASFPYPYPSGHVIRAVILFGALYLLSDNRVVRAGILVALCGVAASRAYLGVHWASDVVGGALLGIAALLWAFLKEDL